MKKILVFLVILALAIPTAAFAVTEFSLGGYIKLDTYWDSSQNTSLIHLPVARSNNVQDNHGRFNMRAQESRFNFTIKGPKLWGAQTTGFIEMDFDGNTDAVNAAAQPQAPGTGNTWLLRLRHAMFRLNWPETELLMGQYWGLFSNWWIESAEDGPFIMQGSALNRMPQIRLTQKFAGDWSVAGLFGLPNQANLTNANPYSNNSNNGSAAETPQIQGQVMYSHDWWGKAAYYGVPKPFTATLSAAWQRNINTQLNGAALNSFGETNYAAVPAGTNVVNQQYVSPWMVQGALFIPVVPTHSANLAGTASILTQWFIGQGVEAFGITGNGSNLYHYLGTSPTAFGATNFFEPTLLNRFGGFVQGQYYFTNQWYLNAAYGITRCFGVNRDQFNQTGTIGDTFIGDQFRTMQQVDATLWYRPIQALKFGLQYSFAHADYFQTTPSAPTVTGTPNFSDHGDEHRVEFVGYFFF